MRKYHQLLLVVISCISIIVLLTYKSENTRLKDVLSAVNFFSRKDAEELRLVNNVTATDEDIIDFIRPMPVWQLIGSSFHAYASYWHRNELVSSGGEVLTLVTGKIGAVVNFRCSAYYDNERIVQGRFRFQHINQGTNNNDTIFSNYIFYCRLKSDLGAPTSIVYTDVGGGSNADHKLRLRVIKNENRSNVPQTQLAICLDLVTLNISNNFGRNDANFLEFFLHHYVLGINQFIIYNGDELSEMLLENLRRHKNLHIHSLPFNFPFTDKNHTSNLRDMIRTDCLLRCMHKAKFSILLQPNEFFFPNAKLNDYHSVMYSLHSHSTDNTAFELQTYSVCIDQKNKLLTNNSFYDPEVVKPHQIYIYRPLVPTSATNSPAGSTSSTAIAQSLAFAHRYIDCTHVGKDGLHTWHNTLRQNFMNNIINNRLEVKELMHK